MGVLCRIYVRKNGFQLFWIENNHCKNKKLKFWEGPKKGHFLNWLVHGFCPKIELFLIGVFHKNHIRKHRFLYCRKKKTILSRKNWSFIKTKCGHFPKGLLHGFCKKIELSRIGFFYRNYVTKKSFFDILDRKKDCTTKKLTF